MVKRRNLGHISVAHALKSAVKRHIDLSDITGSNAVVTAIFEQRLDDIEDSNVAILNSITDLQTTTSANSSSLSDISSSYYPLSESYSHLSESYSHLSESFTSLSQSYALFSASIGNGTINVNIADDAELLFDGDTLMTDADVYISGSGNNLYLHGTNDQGLPAKFEFSIVSGSTFISEVPHTDFGDSVEDPWFKFDGETLLTHADIYVSGANNYLYLNGTDENGDYGIFYFDIVDGRVIIKQTGSI